MSISLASVTGSRLSRCFWYHASSLRGVVEPVEGEHFRQVRSLEEGGLVNDVHGRAAAPPDVVARLADDGRAGVGERDPQVREVPPLVPGAAELRGEVPHERADLPQQAVAVVAWSISSSFPLPTLMLTLGLRRHSVRPDTSRATRRRSPWTSR